MLQHIHNIVMKMEKNVAINARRIEKLNSILRKADCKKTLYYTLAIGYTALTFGNFYLNKNEIVRDVISAVGALGIWYSVHGYEYLNNRKLLTLELLRKSSSMQNIL